MKSNLQKPIGFVVLLSLFICSTTFCNEHSPIAVSMLMQKQNCCFNITRFHNLTDDIVKKLLSQRVETLRNVNQITRTSINVLVQEDPSFRSLASNLTLGLRFGSISNRSLYGLEKLQLGTGQFNYRESIQSTGEVLKRFGNALNKLVSELQMFSNNQPRAGVLPSQLVRVQDLLAMELNQIINSTLIRLFREELGQAGAFHPLATEMLNGFKFGPFVYLSIDPRMQPTVRGVGKFNWLKSFQDSNEQFKRFANVLIGIASQWEGQLVRQQKACKRYLQDTFGISSVVLGNPSLSNTTEVVVENHQENAVFF